VEAIPYLSGVKVTIISLLNWQTSFMIVVFHLKKEVLKCSLFQGFRAGTESKRGAYASLLLLSLSYPPH